MLCRHANSPLGVLKILVLRNSSTCTVLAEFGACFQTSHGGEAFEHALASHFRHAL